MAAFSRAKLWRQNHELQAERYSCRFFHYPQTILAAAGAAAAVLPRTTWARGGPVSASDKITIGVIGWGMMGPANTKAFLEQSDCQVVAACDLDKKHLKAAVDTINQKYGNSDCKAYRDYRELLARDDIDAVMIAIPDQWHAIVATEAANRKKDIYGEKPLARTIAEQQAIVKAVQKNNVIWQTGSWQRSVPDFPQGGGDRSQRPYRHRDAR